MCDVIDQINTVVEEYYPQLVDIQPDGSTDMNCIIPCCCKACNNGPNERYNFSFDDLRAAVMRKEQKVKCPRHTELLLLDLLVCIACMNSCVYI